MSQSYNEQTTRINGVDYIRYVPPDRIKELEDRVGKLERRLERLAGVPDNSSSMPDIQSYITGYAKLRETLLEITDWLRAGCNESATSGKVEIAHYAFSRRHYSVERALRESKVNTTGTQGEEKGQGSR